MESEQEITKRDLCIANVHSTRFRSEERNSVTVRSLRFGVRDSISVWCKIRRSRQLGSDAKHSGKDKGGFECAIIIKGLKYQSNTNLNRYILFVHYVLWLIDFDLKLKLHVMLKKHNSKHISQLSSSINVAQSAYHIVRSQSRPVRPSA